MAAIRLDNVEKIYPNGQVAVRGMNLAVADGEFMVLVGPSGCGKSTLLRIVAGLETPTRGRVFLDGADVTELSPQARDLAMVFQNYALYPHMTVRENLEFGLRMRRMRVEAIAERVEKVARTLGLDPFLDRKPAELSGGQRQRVALGRAIVREPKAFLLDEPLSNLDARLRVQTRSELARMRRHLEATMLYVTHDQEEAMTLGDRVAVLRDGVLQQVGVPLEIYNRPSNTFVAEFIGSPSMNFFRGTLHSKEEGIYAQSPSFTVKLDRPPALETADREILLGVRPHDIRLAEPAEADVITRVDVIQPLGSEILIDLHLMGQSSGMHATAIVPADTKVKLDAQIGVRFSRDSLHLFDAESGERLN